MSKIVRVHLTGRDAQLGSVPAGDVARLLLGVERIAARASGAVLRRRVKSTGRWARAIEEAVRFRLVGIEAGSVVGVLELPDLQQPEDQFDFDITTLGESALGAALRTAAGDDDDIDVARAFVKMAEQLNVGTRYDSVIFESALPGVPEKVQIDARARSRLERLVQTRSEPRADTLVGVLFEADFESSTAKLRAPDGQLVSVSFDEEHADDIWQALRGTAQLVGEVTYDRRTSQAVSVALREINRPEQLGLLLDTGDFWTDQTVEQLREGGGIEPVLDPELLAAADLTEDEADQLLAAFDS